MGGFWNPWVNYRWTRRWLELAGIVCPTETRPEPKDEKERFEGWIESVAVDPRPRMGVDYVRFDGKTDGPAPRRVKLELSVVVKADEEVNDLLDKLSMGVYCPTTVSFTIEKWRPDLP